mgnify:FL=1
MDHIKFFLVAGGLLLTVCSNAENKTFIREYNYQASETDSKVSARQKALSEVKHLLIEELGVYIESYVNYTTEEKNSTVAKDFFTMEIRQISVGIAETKILEERWTGDSYYVKAEMTADPNEVIRLLNKTIEQRVSNEAIDSLQMLLSKSQQTLVTKNKQIDELNITLQTREQEVKLQEQKVHDLNVQLNELNKQLSQYKQDEEKMLSEIDIIRKTLNNLANTAIANAKIGMTANEVKQLCGNPRSIDGYENLGHFSYNYGYVWLIFNNGILRYAVKAEQFDGDDLGIYKIYNIPNLIGR